MRRKTVLYMISFHPTISLSRFLKALVAKPDASRLQQSLKCLFPHHAITLTDSGRSALAVTIEALELRGKTIAMPAYLCDVLLPVFLYYRISPIFLDIDPTTYQPPVSAYTPEVLAKMDAALLVATYGKAIQPEVLTLLKQHRKIVIEDYSHRNPLEGEPLVGDARIYSLQKTLPLPDGGLAVLAETASYPVLPERTFSLTLLKDTLKLLPLVAPLLTYIRQLMVPEGFALSAWEKPTKPSKTAQRLLLEMLLERDVTRVDVEYSYCYPLLDKDPTRAEKILAKGGISAERMWHHPIILHPHACQLFVYTKENYPQTLEVAKRIVCAPLWHIRTKDEYQNYQKRLEKMLAKSPGK